MRINSPYITGSATITGNLCVQGTILGTITGVASTASYAETLDGLDSTQFVQTGSFNSYTSSASSSIGSLSGSVATTTSGLSSSIGSLSSSVATTTSGLGGRINTIEGRYATTGSNTFIGNQVITGSLYITTDLIVQGSSSLQNITASAVSIGTNKVMLNTATPAVRFAGISVQDSGSNAGVTGSIFWDGLCNRWIYSNPSDIGYSGGMLLSGPRTSTLGTESPLTCNYIAKSGGGDHLYDSCIIDDGTTVCINATLKASGQVCGLMGTYSCIGIGTSLPSVKLQVEDSSSTSLTTLYLVNSCTAATITKQNNLSFRMTDTVGTRKNAFQLTAYADSAGGNIENGGLIFSGRKVDIDTEYMRISSCGYLLTPQNTSTLVGAQTATSVGNGGSLTIKAGGGYGSGCASGDLFLASGRGTSSANSGNIIFGRANSTDIPGVDSCYMYITCDGYVGVVGNQGLKCVPYLQGMSFGWNRTNGQGESMINWTNAGGGTACDLVFNFRDSSTLYERLRISSTGAATFNSSISATSLSIGSTTNSTGPSVGSIISAGGLGLGGDIFMHPYNANQSNYGYIKTAATTVNTTTLTLGTTYGYATNVDAVSFFNGSATFNSSVTLTNSVFPVLTVQGTASSPHIGSTWSVSANQDGIGRTIIGTACQGRVMYFENSGDINIPNNTLTVGKNITSSGNSFTYKTGGGGTAKQVVVGQTTATTSGVAKKVAYVGHTHSVIVYVWATQSTSSGVTAIANITTSYGASAGGVTYSSGAMGTVSAVSVGYNNGGSPSYTIDITVTYSGAAPTINYVIEGISHDNAIYTI
jgi:hypothetical protein